MRRISLLALVAIAASLAVAVNASAITQPQQFKASVSPSKAGTKAKPAAVTLKVRPYFNESDITPDAGFATKFASVYFPKELVFNGKFFKSCSASTSTAVIDTKCKNAKVGSGTAMGTALGIYEALTVAIYNGPAGKSVLLHVVGKQGGDNKHGGQNPLPIDSVIVGKLTKSSSGYLLKVPIPDDLQQPAPGAFATLTDFNTTLPKKFVTKAGKKIPYIGLAACSGTLEFGYVGEYTDGTTGAKVVSKQSCKK